MKYTRRLSGIAICCFGVLCLLGSVPGTYSKYCDAEERRVQVTADVTDPKHIFIPCDTESRITCTIPQSGYYLLQLYKDPAGTTELLGGYIYLEQGMALMVSFSQGSYPQLYYRGGNMNQELETEGAWEDFIYSYERAPESSAGGGYCILSYWGQAIPEPESIRPDSEEADKKSEEEAGGKSADEGVKSTDIHNTDGETEAMSQPDSEYSLETDEETDLEKMPDSAGSENEEIPDRDDSDDDVTEESEEPRSDNTSDTRESEAESARDYDAAETKSGANSKE